MKAETDIAPGAAPALAATRLAEPNVGQGAQRGINKFALAGFIFVFSILVQSAFLGAQPSAEARNQNSDYGRFYEPVAQNLISGRGLLDSQGKPATHYPPGFAGYLAGVFWLADGLNVSRLQMIAVTNVILWAATCVLAFVICGRLFGNRPALLTALLLTTYAPGLWLIKQPSTEIPFILLLYLAVWLLVRSLSDGRSTVLIFVGAICALAALIRPVGLFLGIWFSLAIVMWDRKLNWRQLGRAALPVVGFVLMILPWQLYLFALTHSIKPLSTGGPTALVDGLAFAVIAQSPRGPETVPADVYSLQQRIQAARPQLSSIGKIADFMSAEARQEPLAVMKLLGMKIIRCWYGTFTLQREGWILLMQAVYLTAALAGYGVYRKSQFYDARSVCFVVGLMLYFWGMAVLAVPLARYMIPALGLLLVFPAMAADGLLRGALRRHHILNRI